MRYLRMLTNALAGGVLMAMYVAVLIFQLNPQVPAVSETALRWVAAVLAFYVPYLTAALYFLILVRDLLATTPLRPAWLSVRLLAWLGAVGAAAAAALTWANLVGVRRGAERRGIERMRAGAWATTGMAVTLLPTAMVRYSFGRRGSRAVGLLLVVAMFLSVGAPMWLRGPGEAPVRLPRQDTTSGARVCDCRRAHHVRSRVRVFAFDGASLGFIRQRVAAGQLPNFGRLLDRGATIDLATLRPDAGANPSGPRRRLESPPKRTASARTRAIASPMQTRSRSTSCPTTALRTRFRIRDSCARTDPTSASLAARPMWDILADYGLASGVAGWPLTYPAAGRARAMC